MGEIPVTTLHACTIWRMEQRLQSEEGGVKSLPCRCNAVATNTKVRFRDPNFEFLSERCISRPSQLRRRHLSRRGSQCKCQIVTTYRFQIRVHSAERGRAQSVPRRMLDHLASYHSPLEAFHCYRVTPMLDRRAR